MNVVLWIAMGIVVLTPVVNVIVTELAGYKDRKSPEMCDMATLVGKTMEADNVRFAHLRDGGWVYKCVFETDSGLIAELRTPRSDYCKMNEGDYGELSWQGKRFGKFEKK